MAVDIVDVAVADVAAVGFDVEFVIAFAVAAVALTLYYLHPLKTFAVVALAANIVASIGCPIFVTVDFLSLQRYEPVPISVVCRIHLVNLVVRTENAMISM